MRDNRTERQELTESLALTALKRLDPRWRRNTEGVMDFRHPDGRRADAKTSATSKTGRFTGQGSTFLSQLLRYADHPDDLLVTVQPITNRVAILTAAEFLHVRGWDSEMIAAARVFATKTGRWQSQGGDFDNTPWEVGR